MWLRRLTPRWLWWIVFAVLALTVLAGCNNSPQPIGSAETNTLFSAFTERSPRYLDPTASYSNNETPYTYQIYEPLYGYHYLKRPYELIPKTAAALVTPRYLDRNGQPLPDNAPGEQVAESIYDIPLKRGVKYAPHPAFAKDEQGRYLYHALQREDVADKRSPWDFEQQGTRELVADDFVYALKRHATTRIQAPVFGIFSEHVIGLKEYGELIRTEDAKLRQGLDPASLDLPFLDFRKYPLAGAEAPDPYTFRVRLKGKYPQWKYWLAMVFMAPVPWEADRFYAQPGMAAQGLTLNVWPVGTGPYMMAEYVQDRRHVLKRNPHYHADPYPCEGQPSDREAGLLADCGKPMPFIDTLVFSLEKEGVPLKAKFRQGHYDVPEIERPEYGIEFALEKQDSPAVEREYTEKGFKLPRTVDMTNWYIGFNWLDPVVGKGDTPEQAQRNRKLRHALSIALDWEEYARVFPRKGGETAMSPLPAGLFGSRHGTPAGINPVTHELVNGQPVRRALAQAKQLLAEAGYPNGRDAKTGRPLVLYYDYQRVPTPELKSEIDWVVKQFGKLGVQLEVRATDYNQFQDKMRKGGQQIFWWGWLADYPDAENFLFLLYGPNAKAKHDGENAANYANPEYDRRYAQLRLMDDGPEKQKVIDEMVAILQQDAPWAFGFFPYSSGAYQQWVYNAKPGLMLRDQARYYRIDPAQRAALQAQWNRPVWWPLVLLALGVVLLVWRARASFRERDLRTARGEVLKEA
ncbi:ABC transporter substrate-binding protein [Caldimonas brevitalea]|uniref:Peptide ABC transporter substrate-binding protein n=1 Tax=Caldimonas brevitalea TaxID=413882 RepID=A0A0G3BP89_9BURK|nr:ABC transporter substrate-binding protein [Caldimonas brevitalea]AKJ29196.1 peptide ABC transporter substrate-binding protein [Caldimonas brevitalea]